MGLQDWFKGRAHGQDSESAGRSLFHSGREKDGTRREKIKTITIPAKIRSFTTGTMRFFSDKSHPEITVRFDAYRNEEKGGWDIRRFTDVPERMDLDPALAAAIPPGQGDFFNGRAPCDFDALRFLSAESAGRGFRAGNEGAGHYDMPHWKAVAKAAKQPIDNAGTVQPVVAGQVLADNVIFDDPAQIEIRDSTRSPAIVPGAKAQTPPASKQGFLSKIFGNSTRLSDKLIAAAKDGDSSPVERLIADGANVDAVGENGDTALIVAAREGHTEIARMLVAAGANVNVENKWGNTPLIFAAREGHAEIARMLIDADANVDAVNEKGDTPLIWAALKGHMEIVRMLIEADAKVNAVNKEGNTALYLAACEGHMEIARMLIEADANVNAVNKNGNIALIGAAREGQTEIVRMLIEADAKVNAVNKEGNTALILAAHKGHTKIVRMLIDAGAKVNIENKWGNTALYLAAREGHTKIARMLIDKGADLGLEGEWEKTPLYLSANKGHAKVSALLWEEAKKRIGAVPANNNTVPQPARKDPMPSPK